MTVPVGGGHEFLSTGCRQGVSLYTAGDAGRAAVEGYIADVFARTYGARIHSYQPLLLAQYGGDHIQAAVGLRRADSGPLFLEQYLDQPVEEALAATTGQAVRRADIVEIGNLVSTSPGSSRRLFLILAELCAAARVTWAIFTATPEVRHLLRKLAGEQVVLCQADGRRLGASLADWGSYYDTCPAVTAINVAAEHRVLCTAPLTGELLRGYREQARELAEALGEVASCN